MHMIVAARGQQGDGDEEERGLHHAIVALIHQPAEGEVKVCRPGFLLEGAHGAPQIIEVALVLLLGDVRIHPGHVGERGEQVVGG